MTAVETRVSKLRVHVLRQLHLPDATKIEPQHTLDRPLVQEAGHDAPILSDRLCPAQLMQLVPTLRQVMACSSCPLLREGLPRQLSLLVPVPQAHPPTRRERAEAVGDRVGCECWRGQLLSSVALGRRLTLEWKEAQ